MSNRNRRTAPAAGGAAVADVSTADAAVTGAATVDATAPTTTGAPLTDAAVTAAVTAAIAGDYSAYVAADRSGRARIRSGVDAAMRAAIAAGDLQRAVACNAADAGMRAAAGAVVTSAPTDWDAVTAERVRTLYAAADALLSGALTIDGTPDGYRPTWTADPFGGDVDADAVRALATKRATRRGPTNNVADAIVAALSAPGAPAVMSVAAIRRHWVANGGPANADGRIAARLFATDANGAPACTVPGVVPVPSRDGAPRGAALASRIADGDVSAVTGAVAGD